MQILPPPLKSNLVFLKETVFELTPLYVYFERNEKQLVNHLYNMFKDNGVKTVAWAEENRNNSYTFRLIIDMLDSNLANEIWQEINRLSLLKEPFPFVNRAHVVPNAVAIYLKKKATRNMLQAHFNVLYTWIENDINTEIMFEAKNDEISQKFRIFLEDLSQNNPVTLNFVRNLTNSKNMALFIDISGINIGAETSVYNNETNFVSLKGAHFLESVIHRYNLTSCVAFSNKWESNKGKFKYFLDILDPILAANNNSHSKSVVMKDLSYTEIENHVFSNVNKYLSCQVFCFVLGEDNESDKMFLNGSITNQSTPLNELIKELLDKKKVVNVWFWKHACVGKYFYLKRRFGLYKNFHLHVIEDLKSNILFTCQRV